MNELPMVSMVELYALSENAQNNWGKSAINDNDKFDEW